MGKTVAKYLIEIRFTPNARFIDKRGEIASALAGATFDQWNISTNRIDLTSKENKNIGAFLSFKNLGVFANHPVDQDAFETLAQDFLRAVWVHFPKDEITRVGVRSNFVVETKSQKETFKRYRSTFLGLNDKDIKKFGGSLVDVGFPLNFIDGEDFYNVFTGPVEQEQAGQLMDGVDPDDLPDAGCFIDVDFFGKEFSPHITQKNVLDFARKGIAKGEEIRSLIEKWVG